MHAHHVPYLFIYSSIPFYFLLLSHVSGFWYLFAMQHQISAVTLNQAIPRISEEDVRASRHRISVFLAVHTAYELLPESGKVWMHFYQPSFMIYAFLCMFVLISACYFHFANLDRSALQVVALDVDLPVKQAFHILSEQVSV